MLPGREDIDRAAEALASRVPTPLHPLARAAYNLRWSWTPGGPETFRAVDPRRWELCGENPIRLLTEAPPDALERAAADEGLVQGAQALEQSIRADVARPSRGDHGPATAERPVSFFCAEYGIHGSLPIYSGGLGVLAGDILKEASDRALPLVAVGLLYRQGYFRQRIDASGWQHEYWVPTDPERLPMALVTGDDGEPLTVTVPIGAEQVVAQVWRVDVGRVPLFLLDADRPENSAVGALDHLAALHRDARRAPCAVRAARRRRHARAARDRDRPVGGAPQRGPRRVRLARAGPRRAGAGASLEDALAAARARTVFTTHTPVPAGNDTYERRAGRRVAGHAGRRARRRPRHASSASGARAPGAAGALRRDAVRPAHEPLGQRRESPPRRGRARDVGRAVARPPVDDVPIGHVTNGVHLPTWMGGPMRTLLDRHLGEGWMDRAADPATWDGLDEVADAELWAARREQRAALVSWARERSMVDRLGRDEPREYVEAPDFDPDVLTIGFARRLATYKRLHLLLQSAEGIVDLLSGERTVQILIAGKAHPRDDDGKRSLQALFAAKRSPEIGCRVAYLDDYDLTHRRARSSRGCDVWVNLPRPPLEASGTSGMKSAVNGGLQLSVLDGWWAEAYDGSNGWALSGDVDDDHEAQDARDAAELVRLLDDEIVPAFYDRDKRGPAAAVAAR